ncbi:hypothetical protein R3P38DRAFT_1110480 [Favolaschia claudopus]|uniref:Uncharacterized protein n=1 Tax=Favolaschia claudopus TaxID=2862362 RepID=A0AAW0B8Y9_9AGAR
MADLPRSPKSGHEWGPNEQLAYNIRFETIPPEEFFISPDFPSLDHLDPTILTTTIPRGRNDPTFHVSYLNYLEMAALSFAPESREPNLNLDLTRETLYLLDFRAGDLAERNPQLVNGILIAMMPFTIDLQVCKETKFAVSDLCLMHGRSFLVMIVIIKDTFNSLDPQSRLVSTAVAAFQHNNKRRVQLGLQPLETMTIPCIIMSGLRPSFYLAPVTRRLCDAVTAGEYPSSQTVVSMCSDIVAGEPSIGMEDPGYRRIALQRFLAFRDLARVHWDVLDGVL